MAKLGRYKDSLTGLEKLNIPGYNHLVHFQKGYIFGLAGFYNTSLDSFKAAEDAFKHRDKDEKYYSNFDTVDISSMATLITIVTITNKECLH